MNNNSRKNWHANVHEHTYTLLHSN